MTLSKLSLLCSIFGLLWLMLALADAPLAEYRVDTASLLEPPVPPQILAGAKLYYQHCAVCHGDTLGGLAEARVAFPKDKQRCERCHRRNNPKTMHLEQMTWRSAFSIGEAPSLGRNHDAAALAHLANGAILFNYIKTTMPRPFPASLSDEDYLAITAFLLDINGATLFNGAALGTETLNHATLMDVTIPLNPETKIKE